MPPDVANNGTAYSRAASPLERLPLERLPLGFADAGGAAGAQSVAARFTLLIELLAIT